MSGHSNPSVLMPEPINVCKPASEDLYDPPVAPCEDGEGLPYAPVNWPNPGDNWNWRVGKRIGSTGYYTDRFLYLPKSLQKPGGPKQFASKLSLERYIKQEFPETDLDAFFNSFTWKIPSSVKLPSSRGLSSQTEMENVEEDSETAAGKRKQKHTAAASSVKRQTRQTRRQSAEAAGPVNKEERASVANDDLFAGPSSPAEVIAEEFDTYLDSLVSSIAQPLSDAPLPHTISVNSFFQDNEFAESQVLEEDKAKVTSLKDEYNELKGKVGQLQTEIDTNTLSIQDINDQIAQLEDRRTELMQANEAKKMEKIKHTINQRKLAEEIQKLAHEIQLKTQSQNGV